MSKVTFDMSMSLDGFVEAPDPSPEEPLGVGGERLHEWAFGEDERDLRVLAEGSDGVAAVIAGRRTYDASVRFWGADGPTGPARLPVFVVTHEPPAESPLNGVYRFVTGGRGRLGGGAPDRRRPERDGDGWARCRSTIPGRWARDELSIHVVPVTLGGGKRLFDGDQRLQLEPLSAIQTPNATHLRFRVMR